MSSREHHIGHYHRHLSLSYPVSLSQRLYSIFLGPLLVLVLLVASVAVLSATPVAPISALSFGSLLLATLATLMRLAVAYVFALLCAVPLALLASITPFTEKVFLPIFDVLESIPILAFFPVLIMVFIRFNSLNGAAILILFLAMLWNIVFTVVGGLRIIPKDIKAAASVFGVRGFELFRKVTLPAIFPQIVTGSILAVAQGWNIIIVAEVLHTYIPGGTASQDLFGIGNVLVQAAASADTSLFLASITLMVFVIALLNFFVWQKLLTYAERFRFE